MYAKKEMIVHYEDISLTHLSSYFPEDDSLAIPKSATLEIDWEFITSASLQFMRI